MLQVVLVTRNHSLYVKTLHNILRLQAVCALPEIRGQLGITFCDDREDEKVGLINKLMKANGIDRVVWFEYGASMARDDVEKILLRHQGFDGAVYPSSKKSVNWEKFVTDIKKNTTEPSHQIALEFDTEVTKSEYAPGFNVVTKTEPILWCVSMKTISKKLKNKKTKEVPKFRSVNEFFGICLKNKCRLGAQIDVTTTNNFTHECIGSVRMAAGVELKK